jgi:arylformamidase
MSWIDCTHELRTGIIQWPQDTPFRSRRILDMERGDTINLTVLEGGVHVGTHVDAPLHFERAGRDVASLPLEQLCGPATVVHVRERRDVEPRDLEGLAPESARRVLFRTANEELWRKNEFDTGFFALSVAAGERLVELGTLLVGIDYASVDRWQAEGNPVHHLLAGAGIVGIENLDLSRVEAGSYELVALPIKLAGAEGAPCRVILRPLGG